MVIGSVEGKSPAAEAGLAPGDVIVAVDNRDIQRPLDFQRAILDRKPGDRIRLAVHRGNEALAMSLTLGEAPEAGKPAPQPAWEVLGLELAPISPEEFRKSHQTQYRGGLTVAAVRPNSPAAGRGIVPGDVLVGMHIWETVTLENVSYILKRPDFASLSPVKFFILRGDETLYGYLPVGPAKTAQR
jgi:serine protease Do